MHTSYALHSGYERLIHQLGRVTVGGVETVVERSLLASDPRDVLAARDAIRRLLGLPGIEE